MKILLLIGVLTLTGCTPLIVAHESYCLSFTPQERAAFRMLAIGKVKIDCEFYEKLQKIGK